MHNFRHVSNCTRSQRIQQFSVNIMTAENLFHAMFPDVCLFKLGTAFPQKKPSQFKVMLSGFSYILFYLACQLLQKLKGNLVHHKIFLVLSVESFNSISHLSQKLLVFKKSERVLFWPNLPMWVVLQITLVRTIYFYPLRPLYLREATRGGIQSLYSIRADGQQDLLAISCKLPAYFSLEITQFLQITWETFSAEQKPWIGKVLF